MRVIVTRLMDKGFPRKSRDMPHNGELLTRYDDEHRLVVELHVSIDDRRLMLNSIYHATLGPIAERTMRIFGHERLDDGSSRSQVWECEMQRWR